MNDRQIIPTRQIMLIEDNPDDRDLTIRALRKHNILNPVTVASDGAEALAMLLGDDHRDQGNPALILLDLYLPKRQCRHFSTVRARGCRGFGGSFCRVAFLGLGRTYADVSTRASRHAAVLRLNRLSAVGETADTALAFHATPACPCSGCH